MTAGAGRMGLYALLFLLLAISYIDRSILSVAALPIAREFALSPVAMGYLLSAFLWTYLLCLIPVGLMVDRFGAGRSAAGGITVWSLATLAAAFSPGFGYLLGTRLVLGMGEATAYPAGIRMIREHAPVSQRGIATAFLNGGSYAGPAIGALLTGWMIQSFGWRWTFAVVGVAGLAWLPLWALWHRGRKGAAVATDNRAAPGGLAALLRRRHVWGGAIAQGCAVYSQYLFLTWLPSYLQQTKGLNIASAGLYTAIPYAVSVVLGLGICHLSDRLLSPAAVAAGKRRGMVALMLLLSASVLLVPMANSLFAVTLLVSLSLTGIASAISLNFALISDLVAAPGEVGRATSILVFGGNLFGILAPIVTGYIIAGTGSYNAAFAIAGALLLAGITAVLTATPSPRAAG